VDRARDERERRGGVKEERETGRERGRESRMWTEHASPRLSATRGGGGEEREHTGVDAAALVRTCTDAVADVDDT
jgi:hypothetical protein